MSETIIKTGYLEKRSKYLKNWKKRFIVLTKHSILSYVDMTQGSDCTMNLELSECTNFEKIKDDSGLETTLSFVNDGKIYLLKGTDEKEVEDWYKLILENANITNPSSE